MTNSETIDPETIDFAATRERMRLLNKSAFAREIGTSQQAVAMVMWDKWPNRRGVLFQRILSEMARYGFLVYKSTVDKAA